MVMETLRAPGASVAEQGKSAPRCTSPTDCSDDGSTAARRQVEELESIIQQLSVERQTLQRKLMVQRRLISHLRERIELLTGIELQPVEQIKREMRASSKPSRQTTLNAVLGKISQAREPANSPAQPVAVETPAVSTPPAIAASEFLPVDHHEPAFRRFLTDRIEPQLDRARAVVSSALRAAGGNTELSNCETPR